MIELFRNWREALPRFRLADEKVWNEFLLGCVDLHSMEVARLAAEWASRIDKAEGKDIGRQYQQCVKTGVTDYRTFIETTELLKKVSVWSDRITRWTRLTLEHDLRE